MSVSPKAPIDRQSFGSTGTHGHNRILYITQAGHATSGKPDGASGSIHVFGPCKGLHRLLESLGL